MNRAEVWREIARRQREYGNSVGPYENAAGGECLAGSMAHGDLSASQRREAKRDFERVMGARPERFNDEVSGSAQETLEAAEKVAAVLEAREQPGVTSLSKARARRALPATQTGWLDSSWWMQQEREPMEAAR